MHIKLDDDPAMKRDLARTLQSKLSVKSSNKSMGYKIVGGTQVKSNIYPW